MSSLGIKVATSDDIYIEMDGQRIAGVQSYSTKYSSDVKTVDAFGQSTSIGYTLGTKKYTIDITRAYLDNTAIADDIDFYDLANGDFNLVVIKAGNRVTYKNCIVSEIDEDGTLKEKVAEKFTIIALDRVKG